MDFAGLRNTLEAFLLRIYLFKNFLVEASFLLRYPAFFALVCPNTSHGEDCMGKPSYASMHGIDLRPST